MPRTGYLTAAVRGTLLPERDEIIDVIKEFFEIGRTKNLSRLRDIQVNGPDFTTFSDVPPYDLKDFETSIALEELRFASISDYNYKMENPRVIQLGDVAVVAFGLEQSGMLVDNKAFTGKGITIRGRATFVLVRRESWKIIHMHLSKI